MIHHIMLKGPTSAISCIRFVPCHLVTPHGPVLLFPSMPPSQPNIARSEQIVERPGVELELCRWIANVVNLHNSRSTIGNNFASNFLRKALPQALTAQRLCGVLPCSQTLQAGDDLRSTSCAPKEPSRQYDLLGQQPACHRDGLVT